MAALVSSVAFAGMDMDSRVSQLESQLKQVRTQNENNTSGARNANGSPQLDGGYGWFLGVGADYTQARLTGTEFAYTSSNAAIALPINGTLQDIHYGWDWGLHVVGGYVFDHDGFDMSLSYNYLNTSSSGSANAGLGGSVVASRGAPDIVTGTPTWVSDSGEGKSSFSMTMNTLDLSVGRDYFVSQYLSLRPNFGLLSAWFDLEQDTSYTAGVLGINSVYVNDESNFWGLGPDFGVDTNWFIGQGFSVFANGTTALLYGRFNVEHKENYSATTTATMNINGDIHKIAPMFGLALGIAYEMYLDNNKQHLALSLGYNVDYYFNLNQMIVDAGTDYQVVRNNGNLGMQGVTFDLTWSF